MPKQIPVKASVREPSSGKNISRKNINLTNDSINTPEKTILNTPPYCKTCHLARCACKKE